MKKEEADAKIRAAVDEPLEYRIPVWPMTIDFPDGYTCSQWSENNCCEFCGIALHNYEGVNMPHAVEVCTFWTLKRAVERLDRVIELLEKGGAA